MSDRDLLTTLQVAERLGVTPGRVRQLAERLNLGTLLTSRMRIFTEADAVAMAADRKAPHRPRKHNDKHNGNA